MTRKRRTQHATSILASLPEEVKAAFVSSKGLPTSPQTDGPPRKKQKKNDDPTDNQMYYAYGLVPHYSNKHDVPEHLQKCKAGLIVYPPAPDVVCLDFSQRLRLFSLYPEGCLLDEEGWYSVTPERVANQIAERCRSDIVVDAFCGVGGNAIAFARTCERGEPFLPVPLHGLIGKLLVIAMDTSPVRLALARHNAAIYGVADRIEFLLMDYLSLLRMQTETTAGQGRGQSIDVVFLSPPWGGVEYLSAFTSGNKDEEAHPDYSLNNIPLPVSGGELLRLTRQGITPNIAYYLPRNVNLDEVASLAEPGEIVELEEEWMGSKLKAVTCYFGGLAKGQETLFDKNK